jgi:hypothetical protein
MEFLAKNQLSILAFGHRSQIAARRARFPGAGEEAVSNQFLICIEHRLTDGADGRVSRLEPLCRDGRFEGGHTILDHGAHTILSARATEVLKKGRNETR